VIFLFQSNLLRLSNLLFLIISLFVINNNSVYADELYAYSLIDKIKYNKNFKHFDYVNIYAPKKGEISFGVVGNFNSLNPFILSGTSADGLSYTYDTLLERSADELATAYGLLAETININKKQKSVIFKIRKEAKWNDSTRIKSDDVKYSFDMLINKGHPAYKIAFNDVIDVTIINDSEIRFKLKDIENKDLILRIGSMPIFSSVSYPDKLFSKPHNKIINLSGPYLVDSFRTGKYITYKLNDNYWAKNLNINRGRYNFKNIKYQYYRDSTIAVQAFKASEYRFRYENIAKNWANEYNIPPVASGLIKKEEVPHNIPTGMQAFVINNRLEKFQDINIRKALNFAFNFEWTNKNIFFGAYTRTNSFFSNSVFQTDHKISKSEFSILSELELLDDFKRYDSSFMSPVNNSPLDQRRNLIKARDSIAKSKKWHIKNMKLVNDKGEVFTIEFLITNPTFQRVILPYIKNLRKLGIKAVIRQVDYSQYQKRIEHYNYDIIVTVFPGRLFPGNEQMSFFHSANKDIKGGSNLAGIDNKMVDALSQYLVKTKSYDEKIAVCQLLDSVLLHNYYVIPHWNINYYRLVYFNEYERSNILPEYGLDIDSWWYKF
jgi:microcin C transport system substrate-binding protein